MNEEENGKLEDSMTAGDFLSEFNKSVKGKTHATYKMKVGTMFHKAQRHSKSFVKANDVLKEEDTEILNAFEKERFHWRDLWDSAFAYGCNECSRS